MKTQINNIQTFFRSLIVITTILIFGCFIHINPNHVSAQAPEWMEPEIITAFEQAMITPQEMPQQCLWIWGEDQGSNGELTACEWHFTQANVSSLVDHYNPYWSNYGEYRIKAISQNGGNESVHVSIYYDDKTLEEFASIMENIDDNVEYPAIPNAYIYYFPNSTTNYDSVRIRFWISKKINVDVEVHLYNSIAKIEADQMAQLLYSRLSAYGDSPGTTPAPPGSDTGIIDDIPPDSIQDTIPPLVSTDHIPDGALPLAAGASAIILALGALGVALANGIPPHEAIRELLELLRIRQTPPAGGRTAEDILANPHLHDRITDANGKKWVFYKTPGDESGSNHWVSADDYDYYRKMEQEGKTFSQRHGWTDADQMAEIEKNRQIFEQGDIKDREKLREAIHTDQEENTRRMQAEIDRRNAAENKRLELEDLELQAELDRKAIDNAHIDGMRGISREIITGVGKKWDPQSGQYIDSFSWSSLGLRMVTGVASGGTSEYFYRPAYAAYGVNDRLERGETLFHAVMGTANDLSKQVLIGKGIQKATPLVSYGANKASDFIPDGIKSTAGKINYELNKPRSLPFGKGTSQAANAIKPAPISSDLLAKKNAINNALNVKNPAKQTEAIRSLYKNGGMKDMHALEKSGHLTAEQANRINQAMTKEVNGAIQDATNKTMKDFRIATKNGIEAKVDGVKVEKVMLGDSGSSSGKALSASKGRSIYTDNDRTIHAVFDKQQVSAYAKKNGLSMDAAQKKLNDQFVDSHNRYLNQSLKNRGLTANDVDYKAYSGMGSKAGPADSYPEGYTRARQAVQGKTEIYSVNSKGQVNSYNTSGRALTDQTTLDKFRHTGDKSIVESGGAKIIERTSEGKMLIKEQISNLESGNLKSIAKGLERADKGLALIDSSTRVPNEIMAIANYVRNNPQGVYLVTPAQQQELLNFASELAKNLK